MRSEWLPHTKAAGRVFGAVLMVSVKSLSASATRRIVEHITRDSAARHAPQGLSRHHQTWPDRPSAPGMASQTHAHHRRAARPATDTCDGHEATLPRAVTPKSAARLTRADGPFGQDRGQVHLLHDAIGSYSSLHREPQSLRRGTRQDGRAPLVVNAVIHSSTPGSLLGMRPSQLTLEHGGSGWSAAS